MAEEVAHFAAERHAELSVQVGTGCVCLSCAGSVEHVMHIADEVAGHLHDLCRAPEAQSLDAEVGVAFGDPGEPYAALLGRAESAAEGLRG